MTVNNDSRRVYEARGSISILCMLIFIDYITIGNLRLVEKIHNAPSKDRSEAPEEGRPFILG